MNDLIYIAVCAFTIIAFINKSYNNFIILFFTLVSNIWGIVGEGTLHIYDYVNIITIFTLLIELSRNKKLFSIKNDIIGRLIIILFSYMLIAGILSPLRRVESFSYSMMVVRFDIFYLLYFVFRSIPINYFKKSVKALLICTIINGIIYLFQYIGFYSGLLDINNSVTEHERFSNIPILVIPMFFYFLINKVNLKIKVILISFFTSIVILSQTRGIIIAVFVSILLYSIFIKRILNTKMLLFALLLTPIFSGLLIYRFSDKGSTGGGIVNELKTTIEMVKSGSYLYYDSSSINTEGTFFFRVGLIMERIDYLSNDSFNLIFGAGTYHEKSISTKSLPFVFGSKGENDRMKIDTDDVALVSHFFRCGILYVLIYIIFIYYAISILLKSNNIWSQICLLMILRCIFNALTGEVFFKVQEFGFVLLLLAYSTNINSLCNQNDKKNSIYN